MDGGAGHGVRFETRGRGHSPRDLRTPVRWMSFDIELITNAKKNQLDGTEIISLEKNRPTHQAFSKGVSYKEFEKFRGAWVLDIELIERMMLVQMSCEGCIYGF